MIVKDEKAVCFDYVKQLEFSAKVDNLCITQLQQDNLALGYEIDKLEMNAFDDSRYIDQLLEENARLDDEVKRLEKPTDFNVHFDDEKETTLLLDEQGNFTIVRTMGGDTYSREKGFLVAFFQHITGMTKTQANKFLKSLSEGDE